MKLITVQDVMNATKIKGAGGKKLAGLIMSAFKFNRINDLYEKHYHKAGVDFVSAILHDTGIRYKIESGHIDRVPKSGPFIIVSNHPYGGVEGLILIDALQKVRPDIKIIANFLFHKIEPLKEIIFPVNPFEMFKGVSSIKGMKDALAYIEDGHPVLLFPAGEVSTYYKENEAIADRKWNNSALKFIKRANVPIVPVFFKGTNSNIFHMLGKIHPLLRTAKLPSEILNKRDKDIYIRIGNVITCKEQDKFENIARYGRYLRAKTYALDTSEEIKKFFFPDFYSKQPDEVVAPIGSNILKDELAQLPANLKLFSQNKIEVYCAPSYLIPNIMHEIGRLRELTFRDVGEGTNQKIDLDEFDLYYQHLFIWDSENNKLAGAYRIGKGREIMEKYGPKGFYIRSLFKFKREFFSLFNESIELGRSFIVKEYQKDPVSLFLLWKGILYFLYKNPEYRYLIGPVSISNRYSNISKSIIIDYIHKNHYDSFLGRYVKPRKRFRVHLPNVDTDILSAAATNLVSLDKIIADIEHDNYKIPVLLTHIAGFPLKNRQKSVNNL